MNMNAMIYQNWKIKIVKMIKIKFKFMTDMKTMIYLNLEIMMLVKIIKVKTHMKEIIYLNLEIMIVKIIKVKF